MAILTSMDLTMDALSIAKPFDMAKINAQLKSYARNTVELAGADESFTAQFMAVHSDTRLETGVSDLRRHHDQLNQAEVHKKFEAMVLHQFVQHMLPSDTGVIFGEGTSGEIWKGMLAQQIGDTIAKGGGIGIVDKVFVQDLPKNNEPD